LILNPADIMFPCKSIWYFDLWGWSHRQRSRMFIDIE